MNARISGKKYNFAIVFERADKNYSFYIEARTKSGAHRSFINNVNCILSELNVPIDDMKVSESQWALPRKEAAKHFRSAKDFLKDACFREYVEKQLDLDRSLGEWNRHH